ncbi:MAG TPA: BlaI/MecI/CopY family transcriptional regulator [Spirochaetia bacterium]|nr:BlaI/MecI/CopY family transcriptional regulator [Spirochaetia bacterium]HRZ64002.1 BlaI/MecI/CopY family transcriptional regulator [Spirochaetia bacterium]
MSILDGLSKREREVLKILLSLGEATAHEVEEALADGTSYSAVRTFLAALETKGRIVHRQHGQRYVWSPATDLETEGASLLEDAMSTFFSGSKARAIAALIGSDRKPLSDEEYRQLKDLIDAAWKQGR